VPSSHLRALAVGVRVTGIEGTAVAEELKDLIDEITAEQEFTFPGEHITASSHDSPENHSLDDFGLLSGDPMEE